MRWDINKPLIGIPHKPYAHSHIYQCLSAIVYHQKQTPYTRQAIRKWPLYRGLYIPWLLLEGSMACPMVTIAWVAQPPQYMLIIMEGFLCQVRQPFKITQLDNFLLLENVALFMCYKRY